MRARRGLRRRGRLDLRDDSRPRLPAEAGLRHRGRRGVDNLDEGIPAGALVLPELPRKRLVARRALLEERSADDRRFHLRRLVAWRHPLPGGARASGGGVRPGRTFHAVQPRHARGARPLRAHVALRRRRAQGPRRPSLRLRALQRAELRRPDGRRAHHVREVPGQPVARRSRGDGPCVGLGIRFVPGGGDLQAPERMRRARRGVDEVSRDMLRRGNPPRAGDNPGGRSRRARVLPAARDFVRICEHVPGEPRVRRRDEPHRRPRRLRHDAASGHRRRQADRRRRDLLRAHPRKPPRHGSDAVVARHQRELLLQVGAAPLGPGHEGGERARPAGREIPLAGAQPRLHPRRGACGAHGRQARHRRHGGPLRPARPRHSDHGTHSGAVLAADRAPRRRRGAWQPHLREGERDGPRQRRASGRRRHFRGADSRRATEELPRPCRRRRRCDLPRDHPGDSPLGRGGRYAHPVAGGDAAGRNRAPQGRERLPGHCARRAVPWRGIALRLPWPGLGSRALPRGGLRRGQG